MLLPIPKTSPIKLSEQLRHLAEVFGERPMRLREVIVVLKGRAYLVILILLSLPFITPIPLPGLSTPFGLMIGFIALRLVLGRKPWLPKSLQRRELPAGFFQKLLNVAGRIIRVLEAVAKPRWDLWFSRPWMLQAHALLILISALILLLPLPIPFTNSFPAWVVLLASVALLERDGLLALSAYAVFIVGGLYFFFLGEATARLGTLLWQKIFGAS